jgi:hypothetical protein
MSWVKQLIQVAYSVEDYQVSGGPGLAHVGPI